MTRTDILKAIYTKLSTVTGLPQIVYPNVAVTPAGDYLKVFVMPAETLIEIFDGGVFKYGIIQINCVTPDKIGEIKAAEYADKILYAFKNGTIISGGLKVHKPSYVSMGMNDGAGKYIIPVTIRYRILDSE